MRHGYLDDQGSTASRARRAAARAGVPCARAKLRTSDSCKMACRTSSPLSTTTRPEQPDRIYLHGGMSSRMLEELAKGIPVCVTVTELDGLVYSRDAKYHSANYRSVMCFGRGHIFEDEQAKRVMFEDHDAALLPRTHCRTRLHPGTVLAPDVNRSRGSDHRADQREDARRRPQRSTGCITRRSRNLRYSGRLATPIPSLGS